MLMFFCTALIVSSTFSFTFIANNAYSGIWPSDNELIIQEFLLKETENLNDENERRGKQIIELINKNAGDKLRSAVSETRNKKEKECKQEILDLVRLLPTERAKKGAVDYNEKELIGVYPQYVDDIQLLGDHYKDFSDYYNLAVSDYNKLIKQIKGWDATADSKKTSQRIQKWIHKINNVRKELKNKKESISSLKTYKLNKDFSIVRTKYINAVNTLRSDFSDMKETFSEIKKVSDEMNQMFASDNSGEVEKILSKIYLLGIEDNVTEKSKISEKSLKTWKKERNEDFNELSTYLKSLPDMLNVDSKSKAQYNTEDILGIVTVYQRDLLGNLTDFEKAVNYFKYKFPVMAYFSAFIAVFFDLGSFFTGCFLYATEYFDIKEKVKKVNREYADNKTVS